MIKSPYQINRKVQEPDMNAGNIPALFKLITELVNKKAELDRAIERASNLKDGKQGEKGDRGFSIKGDIGATGKPGLSIKGDPGKEGARGPAGRDAEVDYARIQKMLESLMPKIDYEGIQGMISDKKTTFTIKDIEGLENALASMRNQHATGYLHGGGDTIVAGTGITATRNQNGTTTLSAPGGAGLSFETPSGTVNGVNKVFTVLNIPKFLVVNGATLFEGAGYSRASLTLTIDFAPDTDSNLRSAY